MEETCRPEAVKQRGLFDPQIVASLTKDAQEGEPGIPYPRLWGLMVLELWQQAVMTLPAPSGRNGGLHRQVASGLECLDEDIAAG